MPRHPGPSAFRFPPPEQWPPTDDLVAAGADLSPATLLAAYSAGLFPMPHSDAGLLWFSPVRRGVLPLGSLHVSRSLRRSVKKFEVTFNQAFREVMLGCADPSRDGGWIDESFIEAYSRLHDLGWAHSVETWRDGELVGGLYGVEIGGLFAAESKFSRATDASKVALVGLVERLSVHGTWGRLLDVQWRTEHLASLGVVEIPRERYLRELQQALRLPPVCGAGLG